MEALRAQTSKHNLIGPKREPHQHFRITTNSGSLAKRPNNGTIKSIREIEKECGKLVGDY